MISTENQHPNNSGANDIFQKGLSSAQVSFEQILNSPIAVKDINYDKCDYNTKELSDDTEFHVLRTELLGDFNGESFLIFSQSEIDSIIKKCLSEDFWLSDTAEKKKMRVEFIAEIDNILSSSVITEIANELDVLIYGGVPKTEILSSKELNHFIRFEASTYDSVIHFKAVFQGIELEISPNFVWMFNRQILEKIA